MYWTLAVLLFGSWNMVRSILITAGSGFMVQGFGFALGGV
jgi:hypothetical protein